MRRFFDFERHGTSFRTEVLAGLTTFFTMSYIIVVNPAILESAGIPDGASMTATILVAAIGTLMMAFWARRPFAVAPYMGANAFIAFTVVKLLGFPWQTALGAVFLGGCAFILLTVLRIRGWLTEGIPMSLKRAFVVGIGLFLTFIGLNQTGLVVVGVPGAPVHVGRLGDPKVLLAVLGLVLTAILMIRKVPGGILIGILATTLLSMLLGVTQPPSAIVSMPPSLAPIFMKLDIRGALSMDFIPVILAIFVMDFLDTMGTLIALASRADLLDAEGNLPDVGRPMLADAVATTAAGLLGTTSAGAYLESAAGIAAGGKTGFTALVVALLFLCSLFFAPFLTLVPPHAYGPSLIIVGSMMLEPIRHIDFDDPTEYLPAFLTIALMCFTYHIGIGMTAGFILYPLFKLVTGRVREVHPGLWVLTAISVAYYVFQVE